MSNFSNNDRLLVVAKMIVNDMEEIMNNKTDFSLFMGMGFALGRVFSVLRGLKPEQLRNIKPITMMQWIKEQPLPNNTETLVKLQLLLKEKIKIFQNL